MYESYYSFSLFEIAITTIVGAVVIFLLYRANKLKEESKNGI